MFKKLLCAAAAAVTMTGTAQAAKTAKVVVLDSGTTLKFVCDEADYGTKDADWFSVAEAEAISPDGTPPWYGKSETVNKAVFDESFVDYRPTQCYRWFYKFGQLVTIENIENLDTSAVTDMAYMFYHCSNLKTLDLSGFDTAKVTDMSSMFYECLWLNTIFASDKFVTTAVTASDNMFYGCYKLSESSSGTVYDEGKVDKRYARIPTKSSPGYFTAVPTAKVVVLQSGATLKFVYDVADYGTKDVKWFSVAEAEAIDPNDDVPWWDCGENVTKVIFDSSFADYKPKQCSNWLYGFSKLKTIENIENLDTSKATNMEGMFVSCSSLESLDVTRFDTSRVTGMKSMFYECSKLKTIYASDKFVTTAVTNSDNMFYGCTALVGGNGTAYDSFNPADKTYARIDGGRMSDTPGYFTLTEKTAKAVLTDSDTTLRFVFDRQNYGKKDEDWFSVAEAEAIRNPYNPLEKTPWEKCWVTVTAVVFDPSFKDYRPTRCSKWFNGLERLVTIEGIRNLDTSAAICMNGMFDKCKSLESLDITGFDTSKVTDMSYMFYLCKSLRSLDFRNFSTANVTSMNSMFASCSLLTALDLRNFETTKLTDAGHMFEDCTSLAMLDISGFCAAKVAVMGYMFSRCGALRTIIVGSQFGKVSDSCRSDGMFSGCTALRGGKGTAFDSSKVDKTYARIDGGESAPGYFSKTLVPTLFDSFAPGAINPKGATYNGFLGEESLGGTFTLAVKKPKNGTSAATLTKIDPATGKKVKVKGTVNAATGVCAGGLAGLQLNAKGVGGSLGGAPAQGAVDGAKAKDAAAIAVMNGFDKRAYGLVFADAAGERAYLTATFSKKGKVKVAGTFRGAKVSGKAQLCVGDTVCAVPFVWSKKGVRVSFVLWFDKAKRALVDVSGLGAGATLVDAGLAGGSAATYPFALDEAAVRASVPDAITETFLSLAIRFDGKKFDAGKAAKVTYKKGVLDVNTEKGDNVTGLKLSYSKGVLKGGFTVYAVTGGKLVKNKFKVAGAMVNGVGYAAGTNKKLPSIPLALAK